VLYVGFQALSLHPKHPKMAWALHSPRLINFPFSHTTINAKADYSRQWSSATTRRRTTIRANAEDKDKGKDKDRPAFNPFGFVTDNPSSRSSIQLPENPAEDGNVGQMLYVSFT
jgi:hypothetical protein